MIQYLLSRTPAVSKKGEESMVEQTFGQLRTFPLGGILVAGLCLVARPPGKRLRISLPLEEFIAKVEALIVRRDRRRRVRLSFENINTLFDLAKEQYIRAQQERTVLAEKIEASRLLIADKEQERYGLLRLLGVTRGRDQIVEIPAAIQATERVLTIQKRSLSNSETELIELGIQLGRLEEIRQILSREIGGEGDGSDREGSKQLVRS